MALTVNTNVRRARFRGFLRVIAAGTVLSGSALIAQGGNLAMLDRIQPGLWEIRERGESDMSRDRICIGSGRALIQIRHPRGTCQSYVIEDRPGAVTVQYSCRSSGYGRTSIRFENSALAQVESQGIVNGLPFEFVAEARRIGNCT